MTKHIKILVLIYIQGFLAESLNLKNMLIDNISANTFLNHRVKRNNDGFLEETTDVSNLERECVEERCKPEELSEAMGILMKSPNSDYSRKVAKYLNNGKELHSTLTKDKLIKQFSNMQNDPCQHTSTFLLDKESQKLDPPPKDTGCSTIGTQICRSHYLRRECLCENMYEGTNCYQCKCDKFNGTCNKYNGCDCNKGWEKSKDGYCNTDINECEIKTHTCLSDDTCENTKGDYKCTQCKSHWQGDHCDEIICQNSGIPNEDKSKCLCDVPYIEGDFCETCVCSKSPYHGTCNNESSVTSCQCDSGYEKSLNSLFCDKDINECDQSPCHNEGNCINTEGDYYCDCSNIEFTGKHCEIPNCNKIGSRESDNPKKCVCKPFYLGDFCERKDCGTGIIHESVDIHEKCVCKNNFIGENCEIQCNSLGVNITKNNAKNVEVTDIPKQSCPCYPNFTGDICDKCSSTNLIGSECKECALSILSGVYCEYCKNVEDQEKANSQGYDCTIKDKLDESSSSVIIIVIILIILVLVILIISYFKWILPKRRQATDENSNPKETQYTETTLKNSDSKNASVKSETSEIPLHHQNSRTPLLNNTPFLSPSKDPKNQHYY